MGKVEKLLIERIEELKERVSALKKRVEIEDLVEKRHEFRPGNMGHHWTNKDLLECGERRLAENLELYTAIAGRPYCETIRVRYDLLESGIKLRPVAQPSVKRSL